MTEKAENSNISQKLNCWEFKQCERVPGAGKEDECGICPAYLEKRVNGVNSGLNGGRVCWFIEGTFCDNCIRKESDGTYVDKYRHCLKCDFYQYVKDQEGENIADVSVVLRLLRW